MSGLRRPHCPKLAGERSAERELRHSEVSRVQAPAAAREVVCEVCSRTFSREGDKKRHKCLNERSKPVCAQTGAVQCQIRGRWFKSRGGLAVHNCRPGS